MSTDIFSFLTLIAILLALLIIDIAVRIFCALQKRNARELEEKKKPKVDKVYEQEFILENNYMDVGFSSLLNGINEQLGMSFHVQYGTSLSSIIRRIDSKKLDDATLDIVISDPQTLKTIAVIVISTTGLFTTNSNHERRIVELLNSVQIPVITIKKQDFYCAATVCNEIMDAIDNSSYLKYDRHSGASFY
ncbi:hypothetical protein [Photobacterium damselae]|uniref:DUF2726 domain-containing protein n=1 Tax=Photobacterium damselae subsp. damselae TaxID=85581 RepID=A0AAD3WUT8_PHODD|nr:hypothetical protein [Photobacterium damselae]KAB1179933.1 hypothetical protein F6450_12170 [Photobacterium damselae subsp. damselae]MCG3823468.1 hypothetical protein [Photobacterium damselae]